MEIFVGNLPPKVREWEVRAIFEKYGEVTSVKLVFDHITRESKGIAFVNMPDDLHASVAVEELNGVVLEDTHTITVNRSNKTKEAEKSPKKGGKQGPFGKKATSEKGPSPLPRPTGKGKSNSGGNSENSGREYKKSRTEKPGKTAKPEKKGARQENSAGKESSGRENQDQPRPLRRPGFEDLE